MILGLSTSTFTSVHVALSLIGIVSGVHGMVRARDSKAGPPSSSPPRC
jgi:hypothetical protein